MTEDEKRTAASQKLFASAFCFREGAEAVLALGDRHAGNAAALCCQSAQRMITALTWVKKLDNAAWGLFAGACRGKPLPEPFRIPFDSR